MPRRLRRDYPGAWHHVFNRAIARRTLFEVRRDVRFFLSRLALAVRAGVLEIHAFAILTTHFHLLVRSPRGRLPSVMQAVEDAYSRWFNATRGRSGPLFEGRYGSRLIESDGYWLTVLQYIDGNPVQAGLCGNPGSYPHGSARHYLRRKGPAWLRRDVVEGVLRPEGAGDWEPEAYARFLDDSGARGSRWIAKRLATSPAARGPGPLDDLLGAAPPKVLLWMEERAALADGTRPGHVLVAPDTVAATLAPRKTGDPERVLRIGRTRAPFWEVLEAGALRGFCGLRVREIEERLGLLRSTVHNRLQSHAAALLEDRAYRAEAAGVLSEALARDHGPRSRGLEDGAGE